MSLHKLSHAANADVACEVQLCECEHGFQKRKLRLTSASVFSLLILPSVVATGPEPNTGIHHTPDYSSPELLNKLTLDQTASNLDMCASDVWSLGCFLAEALTGNSLFGYASDHNAPLAYQHRLNQARRSQMPWVGTCLPLLMLPCVRDLIWCGSY